MKKTIIIFFIFILINIYSLFAQDTSAARYLPLKIGNTWVYKGYSGTVPCHGTIWYDKYKITGFTEINGKTYFFISHTLLFISGSCSWSSTLFAGDLPIRIDSSNLNIYKSTSCLSSSEALVDSLNSKQGDTSLTCAGGRICNSLLYDLCGISRHSKTFGSYGGWETGVSQKYVENIGLVSYYYYCGGTYQIDLQGCVIDGNLCGDTSMIVGVQNISSEIPDVFLLHQNYPNPFNPSTKIKFDIPSVGQRHTFDLQLTIYNVLGEKVATLVNEQLSPGTYEVDFDGSNYSSGVYYYKISAGEYFETKKMLLIK